MSFKDTLLQFCVPHVPHLSSSVAFYICLRRLLLTAVLVLSTGRIFNCLLNQVCFPLYSTSIKLAGDFVAGVFYSFTASEVRSPIGREIFKATNTFCVCLRLRVSQTHMVVQCSFMDNVLIPSSFLLSVNFDGIFSQFEKLEKFVSCPFLQGHQGSCLFFQILIDGKNYFSPFFGFLVARVFK